jgi:tetratricopeptide (TPR) repeat protein
MGKLDDAIAKYTEVLDIKPGFGSADLSLAYICMLKEDFDEALACSERDIVVHSPPGLKAVGYWIRALINYYGKGKLNQSMKDIDKSQELFRSVGDERRILLGDLLRGAIYFDRHETAASQRLFDKFFSFEGKNNPDGSSKADWAFASGLITLAEGRIPEARLKLKELDSLLLKISPRYITKILRNQREVLYAELLIAEDSVDEAVRVIEKAGPPDLPNLHEESMFSYNAPSARDVAARAYIKKGALDKAIVEYEKIIKFDPDSKDRRFILPKYHFSLAKLYEKQGLKDKAIEQYNRLMMLWKDADTDLPEVKDAKERLAGLKAKDMK